MTQAYHAGCLTRQALQRKARAGSLLRQKVQRLGTIENLTRRPFTGKPPLLQFRAVPNPLSKFTPSNVRRRLRELMDVRPFAQGFHTGKAWGEHPTESRQLTDPHNPLREFFEARKEGQGVWKWTHYLPVYHQHFAKFRGRSPRVLEIGVYSGGSLEMWQSYFGEGCQIYGVDIEEACRAYERDGVKIFIGDQADRRFWERFRSEVPPLDIIIDDGGHMPFQQITTFEESFPHLRPGGVYLCEDLHGEEHEYVDYMLGLARNLNAARDSRETTADGSPGLSCAATPLQRDIRSINLYPFVVAVERNEVQPSHFSAPKRGTKWQPFL